MRTIVLLSLLALLSFIRADAEVQGAIALTAQQKNDIVAAHNSARVAEHASLPKLAWSDALAKIATAYSVKCTSGGALMAHNPNRKNNALLKSALKKYPNPLGNYFGENIYASSGAISDFKGAVGEWVAEKKFYKRANNSCTSGQMCGHYTQVVWKGTRLVGCAYVQCSNIQFSYTLLCDYFPGGNISGKKPF
jgi:pathogenesis-related protein 1